MKLSFIMHFFNEELLIGDWIQHHKRLFDYGLLINHQSTDNSLKIAQQNLPYGWSIVNTKLSDFDAIANDQEVMEWEERLPDGFKIALNTTEFIFCPNLKERLAELEKRYPDIQAFGMRSVSLIDRSPNLPLVSPIWKNRLYGFINYEINKPVVRRWRYIHKSNHGHYETGRHGVSLPHKNIEDLLLLHFGFSPWEQCISRKLAIQTRIPDADKLLGRGKEHLVNEQQLREEREKLLACSYNLMENDLYRNTYKEMIKLYD